MIQRDLKLLMYLEKFRVLSRDQIGKLVCSDTVNPSKTASRICKRLALNGYLTIVPSWQDQQYLYMPKPPLIPINSKNTHHFMAIADLFLQLDQPKHFDVEPQFNEHYRPDIYTTLSEPVVIEVQRTKKTNKIMQSKVNGFMKSYYRKEHEARILWIHSAISYELRIESGFVLHCGLDIDAAMV